MDVTYFLKMRTDFIEFYYTEAVKSFVAIQKSIDDQAPPFDNPPYDESGEPAFLDEWMDADLGREMVGLHCISLLSESMKAYFEALRKRVLCVEFVDKKPFKKGFVTAYKNSLSEYLKIDWSQTNINFEIIEQTALARNDASHAQELSDMKPDHNDTTLKSFSQPFFIDEFGINLFAITKGFSRFKMKPNVSVSKERLFVAISAISEMANVIDEKIYQRGANREL